MTIYRRGSVYWFDFVHNGIRHQKSTRLKNAKAAIDYESAYRTRLINHGVGLNPEVVKVVPTLVEFKQDFMKWVRDKKKNERTWSFYEVCYDRLCQFPRLANARLNEIDENLIQEFRINAKGRTTGKDSKPREITKTTRNRYLTTLRKVLRYACRVKKLIASVPVIELYKQEDDDDVERRCDYTFKLAEYQDWLAATPEPLRSASVLAHDSGICRGEMLALQKDCVHLREQKDSNGFWGTLDVKRGLKRQARRRVLHITQDMAVVLHRLLAESECQYVFTSLRDRKKSLTANTLAGQHRDLMAKGGFNADAGLHALRHTYLTAAGEHTTNVRALQKLAGHSRIETTMRYIHPDEEAAREIAAAVERKRNEEAAALLQASNVQISTTVN